MELNLTGGFATTPSKDSSYSIKLRLQILTGEYFRNNVLDNKIGCIRKNEYFLFSISDTYFSPNILSKPLKEIHFKK